MVCLCTAWTRPLFWIWLYASEEVSSKLIQIWAHRSQLASPCAKKLQCAYGTCMVFVRSARTNYHSLPRICFYISLLTLFQSNCFLFLVGRTTLDRFIVVLLIFINFNGHECCLLGALYLCQAFFSTFCEVDLPYRFLGSFCSPLFAMAFQLFTALVEIMVPSERMCKVKKIRELSKRGVEGEARNATRLLQQEHQKGLVSVEDVDRVATPRIQAILDGLQAASTKEFWDLQVQ